MVVRLEFNTISGKLVYSCALTQLYKSLTQLLSGSSSSYSGEGKERWEDRGTHVGLVSLVQVYSWSSYYSLAVHGQ